MGIKTDNPTPWQLGFGLNHAVEITGANRTVCFSGLTSSAADDSALHPGDIAAQYKTAWQCVVDAA